MSNFITYTHENGEVVFVRRSEITSFHPRYVRQFCYRIYVTVGKETYVVHESPSIEEAKRWVEDQISIIDVSTRDDNKESSLQAAREALRGK